MSIDKNCLACAGNQGDYNSAQEAVPYYGVCKNAQGQINVLPVDPRVGQVYMIKDPQEALNRYNLQSRTLPPNRWTFNYSNTCNSDMFSRQNRKYQQGVRAVQASCRSPDSGCTSCNQCIVQANVEKFDSNEQSLSLARPAYAKLDKTWLSQKPYMLE